MLCATKFVLGHLELENRQRSPKRICIVINLLANLPCYKQEIEAQLKDVLDAMASRLFGVVAVVGICSNHRSHSIKMSAQAPGRSVCSRSARCFNSICRHFQFPAHSAHARAYPTENGSSMAILHIRMHVDANPWLHYIEVYMNFNCINRFSCASFWWKMHDVYN